MYYKRRKGNGVCGDERVLKLLFSQGSYVTSIQSPAELESQDLWPLLVELCSACFKAQITNQRSLNEISTYRFWVSSDHIRVLNPGNRGLVDINSEATVSGRRLRGSEHLSHIETGKEWIGVDCTACQRICSVSDWYHSRTTAEREIKSKIGERIRQGKVLIPNEP